MSRPPARTAVLIGNGAFPQAEGALQPLEAPAHDVAAMASLLGDPEVCRFHEPVVLVDGDAKTIKKTLLRALDGAGPKDLLLVYYAGHGKLDGNQLYLCTHDTEPETLAATSISVREIHHYVSRSASRQVVLVLDCCFSGAAADEFHTRGELSDRVEAAASARGLYLLTSCGAYETSLERAATEGGELPYGVYTRALADGILSGRADLYQDGRITPLELARYLQQRIPGQTPRVSLIDGEGEEPVLAWTSWSQNEGARKRVRARLTQWYADEAIPDELFYQARSLLNRVPQGALDKRRKRLLGMITGAGWEAAFPRAWAALASDSADDVPRLERFLTEQAAGGTLAEDVYLEAMRLLASEPGDETGRKRKRLLQRFARSPQRDVTILVEAWQALARRAPEHDEPPPAEPDVAPEPTSVPGSASAAEVAAETPSASHPDSAPDPDAAPVPKPAATPDPVTAVNAAAELPTSPSPEPPVTEADRSGAQMEAPEAAPAEEEERPPDGVIRLDGGMGWIVGEPWDFGRHDDARNAASDEGRTQSADAGRDSAADQTGPGASDPMGEAASEEAIGFRAGHDPWRDAGGDAVPDPPTNPLRDGHLDEYASSRAGGSKITWEPWFLAAMGMVIPAMIVAALISDRSPTADYAYIHNEPTAYSDTGLVETVVDTDVALPEAVTRDLYDLPNGHFVQSIRFFEGDSFPQRGGRQHAYRFPAATARSIYFDLVTSHGTTRLTPWDLWEAVWYRPDGSVIARDSLSFVPYTGLKAGWGWAVPGKWTPGEYRVEIQRRGARIAMGGFEILSPRVSAAIPGLGGSVSEVRFYDDVDTTAVFRRHFRHRFDSPAVERISSMIRVSHSARARATDFTVTVVYFTLSGDVIDTRTKTQTAHAGSRETDVYFPAGSSRRWEPGTYRAGFYINGVRVAQGFFDVYGNAAGLM